MSSPTAPYPLQQIKAALQKGQEPFMAIDVERIVREALATLPADAVGVARLRDELVELDGFIRQTKAEIAAIRPHDIGQTHIPLATVELDAIVEQTAEATNKIMDECDQVSALAGQVGGDVGDQLTACVTRIFEACNFQDLTGQRIMKVVGALKHIEDKVSALTATLGSTVPAANPTARTDVGGVPLEGPQLKGQGVSQDDIDKLLNS